ncbi:MAG: 3-hydroxyacyl-CoA dehydrogenase family protein, partial [Anaerolineales bacterium]
MNTHQYRVRTAAVVGSGTMGGGIAALLAGVGIPVTLLDIAPTELTEAEQAAGLALDHPRVRNRIVNAGRARIQKSRPAALYSKADAELISTGNLEDDFDRLAEVDWVIEVIVENLDVKRAFFERLEAVISDETIVTSNTSGLPLHEIAAGRGDSFRRRFMGTHFFNPPRYLKLLELIPTPDTDPELVSFFADFGANVLGKGTVVCKDTPSFIANRIGGATSGFRMSYALENGYSVEEVDTIAGPLMGHPKTAVFRLLDLVGIDVARMVGRNAAKNLPHDPAAARTAGPGGDLLDKMVANNWLGNKTKVGFYKQVKKNGGKQFWPLDLTTMEHVAPTKVRFDSIGAVRKIADLGERLRALLQYDDRAAQYAWHTLAFELSYAAQRIPEISDDVKSIDDAVRWGYFHEAGPFEIWDMLGVQETATRMQADGYDVPDWVQKMLAAGNESFYRYTTGGQEQYIPARKAYTAVAQRPSAVHIADLRRAGRPGRGLASAPG